MNLYLQNKSLAINGGEPLLKTQEPHFVWPRITEKIEQAILKQARTSVSIYDRSGIFKDFEQKFADYHTQKHALLFNSGTNAIHAMFYAAGFGPGDEVICPAYTFFASVSPIFFTGAKPVLCDCDENGNIDPEEIRRKITKKTKGVIVTHMWGIPCQMDKISTICKEKNLVLLEDCSHAHGAEFDGKKVGTFGDMAAWSLQGQKIVTGGEGGVLVTNNDEYYYKTLALGHYNKRCKQEIPKDHWLYPYAVTGLGLKYRAHPLAIVIALEFLDDLDAILAKKNEIAKLLISQISTNGLNSPTLSKKEKPSWYALIFKYDKNMFAGLAVETFADILHAEGLKEVDIPKSTCPINLLPLFQNPSVLFPGYCASNSYNKYASGDFPHAEKFYNSTIKLPVWAYDTDIKMVKDYIKGFKKVTRVLQK